MSTLSRSSTTTRFEKSKKSERIRTRAISFNTFLRNHSTSKDTPIPPTPRKQPSSSYLAVYDTNHTNGASSVDTLSEDEDDINDSKYSDTINNNNIDNNNNDFDHNNKDYHKIHKVQKKRSKLHLHIQPSLKSINSQYKNDDDHLHHNNTMNMDHAETPVPTSAPLEKKLSTTFKEKLNLARRSQSTKSTNMLSTRSSHSSFHLWRSSHAVNSNTSINNSIHNNMNKNASNINQSTLSSQPKLYDDGKGLYPPPQKSDPNHRDQYGFIRSTQWITTEDYDTFEQIYTPIIHRRAQKWRSLLEENNGEWPQRSSKFKRYVRKGIPPEFRRQAWLHYSGGNEKMKNNVGVYQQCINKAMSLGIENEHLDIIERDLHRTFPDNDKFKSKDPNKTNSPKPFEEDVPAIQSLRRLLYAFSVYSPSIGYCQSLNYIAGLLLLFMEEEEAFWTFVVLIHDILPPNVYDVTMEGASIDQTILMMLLSERCPHIWQRVSSGRSFWECEDPDNIGMPTSSLVTSHWFLTLFINILPTESVLRVWDCLFYEGRKALMRIALAIFKINEHEILSVTDPLEVFQVVQNMPKRMVDCHQLLDATYHKYASVTRVSDQDLEKRRNMFKSRRDERRKNNTITTKYKRSGGVAGTFIFKAKEARKLVERAKTSASVVELPFFASLHNKTLFEKELEQVSTQLTGGKLPIAKEEKESTEQVFMKALQDVEKLTLTTNGANALKTSDDPCLDLYASMVGVKCDSAALTLAYDHNPELTLKLIFHCRSIHDGKMNRLGFYSTFMWLLRHHPKTAIENLELLIKGVIPNRPLTEEDKLKQEGMGDWDMVDDDHTDQMDEDKKNDQDDENDQDKKKRLKQRALVYKSHGYWKDLLNLLAIYALNEMDNNDFTILHHPKMERRSQEEFRAHMASRRNYYETLKNMSDLEIVEAKKKRLAEVKEKELKQKRDQEDKRTQLAKERHDHIVRLLNEDPLYRCLHFKVAQLFADQLKKDMDLVNSFYASSSSITTDDVSNKKKLQKDKYELANKLSMVGKWAPSLFGSHDKYTLIATTIAELLYLPNGDIKTTSTRKTQLMKVRNKYRMDYLSPLRKESVVTESLMATQKWKEIDFGHVPSICMKNNSKHFLRHAEEEYQAYLKDVAEGKKTISGAVLGPHDFVERSVILNNKESFDFDQLSEEDKKMHQMEKDLVNAQWLTYIRALQEACGPDHSLRGSLAVCDVSGSMCVRNHATGVEVLHAAIGLSLTLNALASAPFKNTMISFSEQPQIIHINSDDHIANQVAKVLEADWGMSTNLYSVFVDLLLPMAKKYNIKQEDMVKRLFIFTDMQFNDVGSEGNSLDTLWETVVKKYEEAGYIPPQIVWWNLQASALSSNELTLQATKNMMNTALVAGFSQNMLKNFMDGDDIESPIKEEKEIPTITPMETMMKDLSKESFSELKVYD
ncbi:unnamed protein product [Cunninghamella blakesleeana]